MALLGNIVLPIATTADGNLPRETYDAVNKLYIALGVLVKLLNDGSPVMISPNGHYWKGVLSNAGILTWTDVGSLRP